MQIVSVEGRLVRDPATSRVVDQLGLEIDPTDPYWARLIADRDVVEQDIADGDVAEGPTSSSKGAKA